MKAKSVGRVERAAAGLCLLLGSAGCTSDETEDRTFGGGEFELVFRGQVGSEPFSCDQLYQGMGEKGTDAAGQDFRFYVSDIRLITESGDEVPVEIEDVGPWQAPRIAHIDFEDATGSCSFTGNEPTNDRVIVSAPEGKYVGVSFSTSVPEDLNHVDPAEAPAPLRLSGMSWGWLLGYRFLRAEMDPVLEEDAPTGFDRPTAQFHLGSVGCTFVDEGASELLVESCKMPNRNRIRFDSFNPEKQVIVADLAEAMRGVDMTESNLCHGQPDETCDSLLPYLGVDQNTGEPLETTAFFRVEDN